MYTGNEIVAQVSDQERQERFRTRSRQEEEKGLAEPFKGITKDGTVQKNVYGIRSTGVSTKPVRDAALKFLELLNEDQKKRTKFLVGDIEWRKWMNQDFYVRQGVSFA
jgi:hypothetical protein